MPFKRSYRPRRRIPVRRRRRRTYTRRYRRSFGNTMMRYSLRGRNPFTMSRMSTVLKYNTNFSLNPTAGSMGATGTNIWQFTSNGLYDPDITGTGHQPLYFDNYAALYSRYKVKYATIKVTCINHTVNTSVHNGSAQVDTTNYSYKLFILKEATTSTSEYPANIEQVIEAGGPMVAWRFVGPSLTGKLPSLKSSFSPHKLHNLSYKDDTLCAPTNANPSRSGYWYVGITSADGVTDPPSVTLNATITYYVDFYDPVRLQPQN